MLGWKKIVSISFLVVAFFGVYYYNKQQQKFQKIAEVTSKVTKSNDVKEGLKAYQPPDQASAHAEYAGSHECQKCHAEVYQKWQHSHHGLAERPLSQRKDAEAFENQKECKFGSQKVQPNTKGERFYVESLGFEKKYENYVVERVIGHAPLRQFLVQGQGGRLHALEACYDPKLKDWFNVYGDEDRQPGEWGHWTGRGMVWNQMCASCHNTRLFKNYDSSKDEYQTRQVEYGVGCESCHGGMKKHVIWQQQKKTEQGKDPYLNVMTRDQHTENCAGCHALRTELTGDFVPGESFWDHYQLSLTDLSDTFYPDGQIRGEDYEFTSFLSSKMHQAGVRCSDCHDMHSMKTILPGNLLCMRCHTPGGFPNAPAILPTAHSFHGENSTGNQCINCHMPQTLYMQRHWRHDHSFSIPDPQLTIDHAVPNACNRCHQDKDANWSLSAVKQWYGEKPRRATQVRADAIAKARKNSQEAPGLLKNLLMNEKHPMWQATLAACLSPWNDLASVRSVLMEVIQRKEVEPVVATQVIRSLENQMNQPGVEAVITQQLNAKTRGVRDAAAWVTRTSAKGGSPAHEDLKYRLNLNLDQPSGQMLMMQYHHSQGRVDLAIEHAQKAIAWDPYSPPFHHDLALLYSQAGQTTQVIQKLKDALQLNPNEGYWYYELGLAYYENKEIEKAIQVLEIAMQKMPQFSRAAYNLALAYHEQGRSNDAVQILLKAEQYSPQDPDLPYVRATLLVQQKRWIEAQLAVRQALLISPQHSQALVLEKQLSGKANGK
jgi:tetratricopeptide (TPR) repeat protein